MTKLPNGIRCETNYTKEKFKFNTESKKSTA